MKNHHTVRAVAAETAIAVQEAPAVNRLVFATAGLGALLSGLMLLLGAGDPATISAPVFFLTPLVPAFCAALLWLPLSFSKRTHPTEARRQSVSAAGLMFILAIIFFFIEWSARFELSLFFAVMLFAWGSRLKFQPLKWAALPYVAAAILLRLLDFPGEAIILLVLGALTIAWPFVRKAARSAR
ncbi:hypothetical protein CVV68_08525 [Arthrobacter livingstonensis]|uniref:Uncharacterized protein n=1 Tax=Arthrobacter livingstonensis TaxID=670078 RepID=A0A2V5LZ77_9MICC|nr:hypothetical protein [Arthrobacter livingstonensis]PYI67896.1 hypothetical protein CVV68_08525 [Arthrobacter livingstonensis]